MTFTDYDDIAHWTHAEVIAEIERVGCACVSNDAYECARCRNPNAYAFEQRLFGQAQPCDCRCHELWHAWCDATEDE